MIQRSIFIAAGICTLMMSGCLLSHSNHSVVRQAEPLQPFSFQSQQARQRYESQVEHSIEQGLDDSHSSLAVPFLLGLERSRKLSQSAVRNDVAVRLDVNGDGVISDQETSVR